MNAKQVVNGIPFQGKNLTGERFGLLTVAELMDARRTPSMTISTWRCICDCGREKLVRGKDLIRAHTRSCGCKTLAWISESKITHNLSGHPLHGTWNGMLDRCLNPKSAAWQDYGGRGITVCDRWRDFACYYEDVAPLWSPGLSADRIDNSKGYEPGNIRFATKTVQANNRRSNRIIAYDGRSDTLANWARHFGLPMPTVWARIKNGWSLDRAFHEPLRAW